MAKKKAYGAEIKYGATATTTPFTLLGGVKDITGPGMTVEAIDVSSHDGNGWTEKIPGIKDGGEVTFEVELDTDSSGNMDAIFNSLFGVPKFWRLQTADANEDSPSAGLAEEAWMFPGFISAASPSFAVRGSIMASVTITVTGAVTAASVAA